MDYLLWTDLETTGSDKEKDCIIEIGSILTTEDLKEVFEFQSLVQPTEQGMGRLMMNELVCDTYSENGLMWQLIDGQFPPPKPHIISRELINMINMLEPHADKVILAGSGVGHFDKPFIARWMPELDKRLAYYTIDVGVIRRTWSMWTGKAPMPFNESKTHRAMDDIRCHLNEAQHFRREWQSLIGIAGQWSMAHDDIC